MVAALPIGEYVLTLDVRSFLGLTASTTFTFTKQGAGAPPPISIVGEAVQSFRAPEGIKLSAALARGAACGQRVRGDEGQRAECGRAGGTRAACKRGLEGRLAAWTPARQAGVVVGAAAQLWRPP